MKCRASNDDEIIKTDFSDYCFCKCYYCQKLEENILKETNWCGKPVLGEKAKSNGSFHHSSIGIFFYFLNSL
jgi:ribonucleotide monophosphatase NagD (HAD superfamily)